MHTGKLVFAQLMAHLPPMVFERCVARYGGNHKVKSFTCMDQYLSMAFAQLTFRASLRDIEACLRSQAERLYPMGVRSQVSRNTLANANATRDWRIYADFAQHLIGIARRLYVDEPFGVDLANTAYALDSTTIDLSLSLFPWAAFRSTKAAVKMHTLLDLRGNIPSFIHISDGKLHDVNILDQLIAEAGAFYVMDHGYIDFARLYRLHQAGAFFVTRAKRNMDAQRRYSHPVDRSTGLIYDQTLVLQGYQSAKDYPEVLRGVRYKDPETGKRLLFLPPCGPMRAIEETIITRERRLTLHCSAWAMTYRAICRGMATRCQLPWRHQHDLGAAIVSIPGKLDVAALSRLHFHVLSREEQAAAIRRLAAAGQGEHTIAHATGFSVEQIRRVLAAQYSSTFLRHREQQRQFPVLRCDAYR